MKLQLFAAATAVALFAAFATAEDKSEALKSGPQVGTELAGPFHPLNINGKKAGEKHCLYCENGDRPVVMIFAREPNEVLGKLLKKLETAIEENKDAKLASFVVFCTKDQEGVEKKAKKCAEDCGLKKVVLAIDNPAGPEKYDVSEKADVTVILYKDRKVVANYAFAKDKMTEKDGEAVIKDISKIVK